MSCHEPRTPLLNLIKVAKLIHETSSGNEARILLTSKRVQKRQVAWHEVIGDTRWHMQHMLLQRYLQRLSRLELHSFPFKVEFPAGLCVTLFGSLWNNNFAFRFASRASASLASTSQCAHSLITVTWGSNFPPVQSRTAAEEWLEQDWDGMHICFLSYWKALLSCTGIAPTWSFPK